MIVSDVVGDYVVIRLEDGTAHVYLTDDSVDPVHKAASYAEGQNWARKNMLPTCNNCGQRKVEAKGFRWCRPCIEEMKKSKSRR